MSKATLFENIYVYRVLSDREIGGMEMSEIVRDAEEGDLVGDVVYGTSIKRSKAEMANLLYDSRSEPGFFSIDEDIEDKEPSVSKGLGTWVFVGRIPGKENETMIFTSMTLAEARKAFTKSLYEDFDISRASVKRDWGVEVYMDAEVRVDGLAALV